MYISNILFTFVEQKQLNMKGTIVKRKGLFYVEYSVEASEPDEIDRKLIRLSFDQELGNLKEGDIIDFECVSFGTVDGLEIAIIKN